MLQLLSISKSSNGQKMLSILKRSRNLTRYTNPSEASVMAFMRVFGVVGVVSNT